MNDLSPPDALAQPVHLDFANLEPQDAEKNNKSWLGRALSRVTLKADHAEILANIKFPCC